ncbi:MAG: ATP-binding protein [Bifidobacteriaceae bacterium]|jgi:predicted AAA+ superfamily ATPase|nr:ATP-binding protein [Bifidobacteriaceae bacterium]
MQNTSSLIPRPEPLRWLRRWRDRDIIKAVTGVRRCGKSTVLRMFAQELLDQGVPPGRVVEINLEDPSLSHLTQDHQALYEHIRSRLAPGGTNYVFVDEFQNADSFERVVDGLFVLPEVDLYVTGSTSRLLAGPLATLLSGRYVELKLLPLSFAEYVSAFAGDQTEGAPVPVRDLFDAYTRSGSFPFAIGLSEENQIRQYLEGIVDTVLFRDVAAARHVASVAQLRAVTEFVFSNIGNLNSVAGIANTMTSAGRRVSRPTVESFLEGLADAHQIYPAPRWDVRGKRLLESGVKHYVVDVGLRRAILGDRPTDAGRVLENIVYLELLRRGGKTHVGKAGAAEIDFVVESSAGTAHIQVALSVAEAATLRREMAPLSAASGADRRLLLVADREPPQSIDGVRRLSVFDWLLGQAE